METTAKVLETMRSAGKPVSAGEVATLSGLDRKEVDKAFAQVCRGCGADALHPHGLTLRYSGRKSHP